VEHGNGVVGEQLAVTADAGEAELEIGGGILGHEGIDAQARVDAGVEATITAQGQAILELREPDQDEGE
jgi:hypothetical protein